jgi:hypothetical protein
MSVVLHLRDTVGALKARTRHNRAESVQVFFVPTDDGLPRPSHSEPNDPK